MLGDLLEMRNLPTDCGLEYYTILTLRMLILQFLVSEKAKNFSFDLW
jgi:hypothetical protein